MPGIQTQNGKAFEYACLKALFDVLHKTEEVFVEDSKQLRTAEKFFSEHSDDVKHKLMRAARAAIRVLLRLEPQLQNSQNNIPLYLSIQTDAQGMDGDVRDIICVRKQNEWQIGLSCKHNHHAVKHSRLSDTIDFGQKWFGISCSNQYFSEVIPLFNELRVKKENARQNNCIALWNEITDKEERYYRPILQAFLDELNRMASKNAEIPRLLIKYLLGKYDFYKIITDDKHEITRIEAINITGTLNRPAGSKRSIVDIPRLKLPTRFYHTGFKPKSNNTVEVVCDEGWTISMRIHNASSRVEPSLKFDVNLISLPGSIYAQVEPW